MQILYKVTIFGIINILKKVEIRVIMYFIYQYLFLFTSTKS